MMKFAFVVAMMILSIFAMMMMVGMVNVVAGFLGWDSDQANTVIMLGTLGGLGLYAHVWGKNELLKDWGFKK